MCALQKVWGNYNQQRNDIGVPLTKALERSFKAVTSGSAVAKLIRSEDPQKKGYVPDTVAQYVDAAARHAVNKTKPNGCMSKRRGTARVRRTLRPANRFVLVVAAAAIRLRTARSRTAHGLT